jgi:hypothetical protein
MAKYDHGHLKVSVLKLHDPASKISVQINSARHIMPIDLVRKTRGEFQKRVMKEPFREMFCGMGFSRNHKLFDEFNRRIIQLFEAGIIGHFRDEYKDFFDPKFYEKPRLIHKKYLETTWRK